MSERKYKFDWDIISGNVDVARPMLGATTRVEILPSVSIYAA